MIAAAKLAEADKPAKVTQIRRGGVFTILGAALALAGRMAQPVTDAQVAAVVTRCKELGMAVRVFNGLTSFAECVSK